MSGISKFKLSTCISATTSLQDAGIPADARIASLEQQIYALNEKLEQACANSADARASLEQENYALKVELNEAREIAKDLLSADQRMPDDTRRDIARYERSNERTAEEMEYLRNIIPQIQHMLDIYPAQDRNASFKLKSFRELLAHIEAMILGLQERYKAGRTTVYNAKELARGLETNMCYKLREHNGNLVEQNYSLIATAEQLRQNLEDKCTVNARQAADIELLKQQLASQPDSGRDLIHRLQNDVHKLTMQLTVMEAFAKEGYARADQEAAMYDKLFAETHCGEFKGVTRTKSL